MFVYISVSVGAWRQIGVRKLVDLNIPIIVQMQENPKNMFAALN